MTLLRLWLVPKRGTRRSDEDRAAINPQFITCVEALPPREPGERARANIKITTVGAVVNYSVFAADFNALLEWIANHGEVRDEKSEYGRGTPTWWDQ